VNPCGQTGRMRKPTPARDRMTNGSGDTASLRNRGSPLIWLDRDMTWLAPHAGRPAVFSDAGGWFCLTIKILFKPLRQTMGMVAIGTVTAPSHGLQANRCRATDGAHDTRLCHSGIIDRQATPILPIRKNGGQGGRIARPQSPETKPSAPPGTMAGFDGPARPHRGHGPVSLWKRWTGRSRAEARTRCLNSFGERIAAVLHCHLDQWLTPDRQTAEIRIRSALINRFNALGIAEIVRLA